MFGESESESPRVPSPWDSIISSSPSPSPLRAHTPSPLAAELIPRLVPESDDGNVEYKLQLLSPSPARFARLVTQMKWRLLEGGGQAYYELGVADSGHLVGLPRAELEQSLETLEMMAGEIGASVIVVKEIEVPAALVGLAGTHKEWGDGTGKRRRRRELMDGSDEPGDSTSASTNFTTETETETDSMSATDVEEDLSMTVVLGKSGGGQGALYGHLHKPLNTSSSSDSLFTMDPDPDPADNADVEVDDDRSSRARFSIDLEISSVYKPRPVRTQVHNAHDGHPVMASGKTSRMKKQKNINPFSGMSNPTHERQHHNHHANGHNEGEGSMKRDKASNRRQARDRKREERRRALVAIASQSVLPSSEPAIVPGTDSEATASDSTIVIPLPIAKDTEILVSSLKALHISLDEPEVVPVLLPTTSATGAIDVPSLEVEFVEDEEGEDDVFASPSTAKPSFSSFSSTIGESHLDVDVGPVSTGLVGDIQTTRLIVEVLVVRKMSIEEGFLDFGGFALI